MDAPAVSCSIDGRTHSFSRFCCIPKLPDWLWFSPSFLVGGYGGHFSGIKRPGVKLTNHLHTVPRLRMRRCKLPLPVFVPDTSVGETCLPSTFEVAAGVVLLLLNIGDAAQSGFVPRG